MRSTTFCRIRAAALRATTAAALVGAAATTVAAQLPDVPAQTPVRVVETGASAPVEAVVVRSTRDSLTVATLPDSIAAWPGPVWLNPVRISTWPQRTYARSDLERLEVSGEIRHSMRRGALGGALVGAGVGALIGWAASDSPAEGAAIGAVGTGWMGMLVAGAGAESRWPTHWRLVFGARR